MSDRAEYRIKLAKEVEDIWLNATRRGRVRPTTKQRDLLTEAYHSNVLPKDKDYSLHQWVEDNFPEIGG